LDFLLVFVFVFVFVSIFCFKDMLGSMIRDPENLSYRQRNSGFAGLWPLVSGLSGKAGLVGSE
jgi:hypothetical protein